MKIEEIINLIHGELITSNSKGKDYSKAFASDLMSDCLAYVNDQCLLITGLTNAQALRTAEMLDIDCIIFARGKKPSTDMINLAVNNNMTLVSSPYTVYEVSGILYQAGLEGLRI